jgi:hypothetical protein
MENRTPGKADRSKLQFPPGRVGEIAQFIFDAAPRPVAEIAFAGAIGFMAGICGRAYNVFGAGLNLYILLVAETGVGKEAARTGVSKLISALKTSTATLVALQGPSYFASAQALYKELAENPCFLSIIPEFGLKLKAMAAPHAPAHVQEMQAAYLDLHGLSGHGQSGAGMRYSDKTKNVPLLQSPALTILGETNQPNLFANVDETLVTSGLLPRFIMIEYLGDQVELNENHHLVAPSETLLQNLAATMAQAQGIVSRGQVCNVTFSPEAKAVFDAFERWTRAEINSRPTEVARHLWTRAHLKAAKLAALIAVGCNFHTPQIDADTARDSIEFVQKQTVSLIFKFSNGEVGAVETNETLRRDMVLKTIFSYATTPFDELPKSYSAIRQLHARRIIPLSYLQKALSNMACFRRAPGGATKALKATIENMRENDELGEIPKRQMVTEFGTNARAYETKNPTIPRSFIPTKPEVFFEH